MTLRRVDLVWYMGLHRRGKETGEEKQWDLAAII
jgi:hypothetical protein